MGNKEPLKTQRIRKKLHKEQPAHHEDKVKFFKKNSAHNYLLKYATGVTHTYPYIYSLFDITQYDVTHTVFIRISAHPRIGAHLK